MKRLLSLLVSLVIALNLMPVALAATDEAVEAANELYKQGLFKGTGTNTDGTPIFDLDKTPTRNQAIIMLVRLLGKEDEALAGTYEIPFTDVSEKMRPYIGYAYTNGLTNGTSATTYSGENPISVNQYVSFVLRTLGYQSGVDFEVPSSLTLSDKIGITSGQYSNSSSFTRGDVAIISYRSLSIVTNGKKETSQEERNSSSEAITKPNNIIGDELEELKKDCARCIIMYQIILEEVDIAIKSTTMPEFTARIKSAYDSIETFKDYLASTYQSCGFYDNTQTIKENAGYIYTVIDSLPTPENPDSPGDLQAYMQQYLSVMMGANNKWSAFKAECSTLVE